MIRRLGQRLAWAVFIVWAVTSLAFVVNNVLPSDPARMVAGPQAQAKDVARIRAQLGLDRPLAEQYGVFMRRLLHVGPSTVDPKDPEHRNCGTLGPLHVDLGRSYQQHRPVVVILEERLPRTILLGLAALALEIVLGVSAGVLAALRRRTFVDTVAVGLTLLGISAPTFVIGLVLQYLFAHKLRLLPLDGYGQSAREHAACIVLPALTLGVFGAAYYTRLVRDEMIVLLKQDYVRTARAKGVDAWGIVVRHCLRNALVPLVTVVGLDLGVLVGGAIVTETLFRWPGIGALSVSALLDRDGPVILGTVLVTSAAIVLSNVAVDFCYALFDPRVRN